MKNLIGLGLVLGAILLAATALADESGTGAVESPLYALGQFEQRECAAFGEAYLRMAELRDAGADKSVAINRGVEYLSSLGRTGSHHKGMNYKPAVTGFADFVFANPKLYRGTVYLYGISSCAISKKAPDDPAFDRAMDELEQGLGRCQKKYSDHAQVRQMGACVLDPVNAQLQDWAKK